MEPLTAIVTALALGAAAGLKDTAAQAVRDSYAALKSIIQRKYKNIDLNSLEEMPESKKYQERIKADLAKVEADEDVIILDKCRELLKAVEADAPDIAVSIGVDLNNIKAASLRLRDVIAAGTGVKVKDSEFSGDIDISNVRAGVKEDNNSKK